MLTLNSYLSMMSVKAASLAVLFMVQVVLARALGVEGYGSYSYLMSLITVISLVAVWGGERYIVKTVSLHRHKGNGSGVTSTMLTTGFAAMINSLVVFLLLLVFLYLFKDEYLTASVIGLSFMMLVAMVLSFLTSALTKGLGNVLLSEFIMVFLRPLIALVLFVAWLYFEKHPNVQTMMLFVVLSYVLSSVITHLVNNRKWKWQSAKNPIYLLKHYKQAFPYFVVSIGMPLLSNIDIVVLGTMRGESELAIYVVCSKIINVVLLGLVAANVMISPRLPVLFHDNKMREMQAMITRNNNYIVAVTVIPVIAITGFGSEILRIFGDVYTQGYWLLMILLGAQVINVAFGPVNLIAGMTGYQQSASYVVIIACVMHAVLCIVLVPEYGIYGAAISNLLAYASVNYALARIIRAKIGIESTVLSSLWNAGR